MVRDQHTDDLHNVAEGDEVILRTTKSGAMPAECIERVSQHADERTGEVRRTTIWTFDTGDRKLGATILDGLKSSADDPDFPQYTELWDIEGNVGLGYIKDIDVQGPTVQEA